MGQHTLLRIMTRKSLMKFGEFADYTVDQLFSLERKSYLRWVYYNCANISFNQEVLEMLNIEDMQIDKPGKDVRTYNAVHEFFQHFISWKAKRHYQMRNNKVAKSNIMNLNNQPYNRKSYLQSKNHGH